MTQKTVAALVLVIAQLVAFQSAQAYPDRPIKLVVASPAGSPPDVMARLLSDKVASALGQPVVVDNRPGAGGTIGARAVERMQVGFGVSTCNVPADHPALVCVGEPPSSKAR